MLGKPLANTLGDPKIKTLTTALKELTVTLYVLITTSAQDGILLDCWNGVMPLGLPHIHTFPATLHISAYTTVYNTVEGKGALQPFFMSDQGVKHHLQL